LLSSSFISFIFFIHSIFYNYHVSSPSSFFQFFPPRGKTTLGLSGLAPPPRAAHNPSMLTLTPEGLYCSAGGFHIDPLQPVEKAVLTHAHADHARQGLAQVWASTPSVPLLRQRLGDEPRITGLEFGEEMRFGGVGVSLHPAGHMLGSAQIGRASCRERV
jgi:L-ascorbate metabolism protein UlaG (beta-lactamase superfamily)